MTAWQGAWICCLVVLKALAYGMCYRGSEAQFGVGMGPLGLEKCAACTASSPLIRAPLTPSDPVLKDSRFR